MKLDKIAQNGNDYVEFGPTEEDNVQNTIADCRSRKEMPYLKANS